MVVNILLCIIILSYIILFCFPAFMFTWEKSVFEGIGCYGWICMLVGFPGAILAGVILIMKDIRNEKQRKKDWENIEKHKAKARKESEMISNKKEEDRMLLEKQWVNHYLQSSEVENIIDYIRSYGEINKITIYSDGIEIVYMGGVNKYEFLHYGIENFSYYMGLSDNYEARSSKMYFLGLAINHKLGNIFSVSERIKIGEGKYFDGEKYYYIDLIYVELTKKLKSI